MIYKRVNINTGKPYLWLTNCPDNIVEFKQLCKTHNIKLKLKLGTVCTCDLSEEQLLVMSLSLPEIHDSESLFVYAIDQQKRDIRLKASMGVILDFLINYVFSWGLQNVIIVCHMIVTVMHSINLFNIDFLILFYVTCSALILNIIGIVLSNLRDTRETKLRYSNDID